MKKVIVFLTAVTLASLSMAQSAQRTTNPNGVQIKGNTVIDAEQKDATAVAVGEGNVANNTAGAISGNTDIKGNTTIKAKQSGATAVAVGKNNTAVNQVGVIGGK